MKNILKKTFAAFAAAAVSLSCISAGSLAVFADEAEVTTRDIECSHVVFTENTDGNGDKSITAESFVRDYSGSKEQVFLICAAYDSNGVLRDAKAKSGMNGIIKTDGVSMSGGEKVVAYIWDKNSIAPMAKLAAKGETSIAPEITFDGTSFASYVGSEFNVATQSYTASLKKNSDGIAVMPKVKASIPDNSGNCEIINDAANLKTTVRVYYGPRTVTTEDVKSPDNTVTYSTTREKYMRAYTDYTISYLKPENSFFSSELTAYGNALIKDNIIFTKKFVKKIELGDNETYKKVTMPVNVASQATVIIVKPSDGTKKDAVVNSDGTALTWDDDKDVRCGYENNTVTYGNKNTTAVTAKKSDTTAISALIGKKTESSDNEWKTGSRIATDRAPISGNYLAFGAFASNLEGYNYIVFPSATVNDATVEFTVGCNSDIILLVPSSASQRTEWGTASGASNETDTSNLVSSDVRRTSTTACYGFGRYQNEMPVWHAAMLIKEGVVSGSDKFASSGSAVWTCADKKATTEKISKYRFKFYKDAFAANDRFGNTPYVPVSSGNSAASFTTLDTATAAYTTVDTSVCNPIVSGLTMHLFENETGGKAAVRTFPDYKEGIYSDRTESTNRWRTGAILSYGEALELDNAVMISPALDWINSNTYKSTFTGTSEAKLLYSFKVERDCEVLIASTGNCVFADNDTKWVKATLSEGYVKCLNDLEGTKTRAIGSILYARRYSKGDTVNIYTPQTSLSAPMVVFVRELD